MPITVLSFILFFISCEEGKKETSLKNQTKPVETVSYPYPPDNRPTPERILLGKTLFFDPILSGSNWISCATCHNPGLGWSDGLKTAVGHNMKVLGKNTPTILNGAYGTKMFWDGRADNLESQALGPITSPDEMNQKMEELILELKNIPGYRELFSKAYPKEDISALTIGKAIANFERTILSSESPYDLWKKGDKTAMSESAQRGYSLFNSKANCVACHQGEQFTDNGFHNIGLKSNRKEAGRFALVPVKAMKGAFKTPGLRDVAKTGPYMHDGSYATLEEVVEHYDRGGDEPLNLDPNMSALKLTVQEKADLVEFMKSLNGKTAPISIPEMPR
ncbi:tryptophan tryptophylquinone biosynthesis enzyme MauG [Leptospira gomenensis]|uniref:Methylamine utilization protein MauG n=1 Tax=Leptospira gomenensis TaxID=2484974 RepID=A0A5F1YBH1_9LEPT|nr:tryptophan tryptophylquinone biosynthesis enzyme MauG [Leptospira gomenensis]TGK40211.1 tryptophan tryptophylquinone biosynthesis enzyme MauG [Leptospira gomenensis]TGK40505.1 tryptophan tryptophylquinone biosynthesis enzyme MauG [Leptospira gomenensis]TGK55718.1 tryptophan tryptophylquinone biosynthesis enzyme MauG [Leptospira gomenensis]